MRVLILFFLAFYLFSNPESQASSPDPVLPIRSIGEEASRGRPAKAKGVDPATENEIQLAKCKTQIVPSTTDLKKEVQLGSISVDQAFRDFKIPANRLSSKCGSSLCQVLNAYGVAQGYRLLFLYRLGFNGSSFIEQNARPWKTSELNDLIAGVIDLPMGKFKIRNHPLTRFVDGYTLKFYGGRSQVAANAQIQVFDLWDDFSSAQKHYAIFHEISHGIDSDLKIEAQSKNLSSIWNASTVVSEYGDTNRAEDIAESISGYRYSPGYLKNLSSSKYRWIRDHVFNGIEFNSEVECTGVLEAELDRFGRELYLKLSREQGTGPLRFAPLHLTDVRLEQGRKACFGHYYGDEKIALDQCLNEQSRRILQENKNIVGKINFNDAWGAAREIQRKYAASALQPFYLINTMIARAFAYERALAAELIGSEDPRIAEVTAQMTSDLSVLEKEKNQKLVDLERWVSCAVEFMSDSAKMNYALWVSKARLRPLQELGFLTNLEGLRSFDSFKSALVLKLPIEMSQGLSRLCANDYRLGIARGEAPPRIRAIYDGKFDSQIRRILEGVIAADDFNLKYLYADLKTSLSREIESALDTGKLRLVRERNGVFDESSCSVLFPNSIPLCQGILRPSLDRKSGDWEITKGQARLEGLFSDL